MPEISQYFRIHRFVSVQGFACNIKSYSYIDENHKNGVLNLDRSVEFSDVN